MSNSKVKSTLQTVLPPLTRPRYLPRNRRVIDGKSVLIAFGLLVAFALAIVVLIATSKPAHVHHATTPSESYSTEGLPDDGIMAKDPDAGMPK